MDSTYIAAINANTDALNALNGSLWVAFGFIGFLVGGSLMLYYTLKGH